MSILFIWPHQVLVTACGIQFPDQGLNPGPLLWEVGISATGPPGKSFTMYSLINHVQRCGLMDIYYSSFGYVLCRRIAQSVKNLSAMLETWVQFLGREDSLEKEVATPSSILAWKIPWTEEPGGLHSIGRKSWTRLSTLFSFFLFGYVLLYLSYCSDCPSFGHWVLVSIGFYVSFFVLFLFSYKLGKLHVCVHAKSLQSCPTLCNPEKGSLPGSSVHGILWARILEWVSMPSCRGSSWPRDQTDVPYVSCTGRKVLYH